MEWRYRAHVAQDSSAIIGDWRGEGIRQLGFGCGGRTALSRRARAMYMREE
jgi:hypothetical protein